MTGSINSTPIQSRHLSLEALAASTSESATVPPVSSLDRLTVPFPPWVAAALATDLVKSGSVAFSSNGRTYSAARNIKSIPFADEERILFWWNRQISPRGAA